jgi:hypothetical protein
MGLIGEPLVWVLFALILILILGCLVPYVMGA